MIPTDWSLELRRDKTSSNITVSVLRNVVQMCYFFINLRKKDKKTGKYHETIRRCFQIKPKVNEPLYVA